MNIAINKKATPEGSRFLYRDTNNNLKEATIREWSYSGDYLNFDGKWLPVTSVQDFIIVERLTDDTLWSLRQ